MTIAPLSRRSRARTHNPCYFDWRGRDLTLDARTGQAATFSRAATATARDRDGTAITVVNGQPAFTCVDTDSDAVRDALAVRTGSSDVWTWAFGVTPRACLVYHRFVDAGLGATANAVAFVWGSRTSTTGPYLMVKSDGTDLIATYKGTGVAQTSTAAAAAPASGDVVELLVHLTSGRAVALAVSLDGATAITGSASAGEAAFPAAMESALLTLTPGGSWTHGDKDDLACRIAPVPSGTYTTAEYLAYMRNM